MVNSVPYKAIILGLDGTLLDTLADIGDAANRVLAARGFPTHDLDAFRHFIGHGASMTIASALPESRRTPKNIGRCTEAFMHDYSRSRNIKTKPYKGIPELLDSLSSRGLKMAVLSNKPHFLTMKCVEDFFPGRRFHVIIGRRGCIARKPDSAGALEIAGKIGLAPSEFLFMGDSAIDMQTAIAAGMFPVGVRWGFGSAGELVKAGCRALIDRPMGVLNLL